MRHPRNLRYKSASLDLTGLDDDLVTWLESQAAEANLGPQVWLLAHAFDGIIWGYINRMGKLQLSTDTKPSTSPPLASLTLMEARLFGANGEIHLWRNQDASTDSLFNACYVWDVAGDAVTEEHGDAFDEFQLLWGTEAEGAYNGFTLLNDGQEGLRHAVPIEVPASTFDAKRPSYRPVSLCVRHYLDYRADTGESYIAMARLVGIQTSTYTTEEVGNE